MKNEMSKNLNDLQLKHIKWRERIYRDILIRVFLLSHICHHNTNNKT